MMSTEDIFKKLQRNSTEDMDLKIPCIFISMDLSHRVSYRISDTI